MKKTKETTENQKQPQAKPSVVTMQRAVFRARTLLMIAVLLLALAVLAGVVLRHRPMSLKGVMAEVSKNITTTYSDQTARQDAWQSEFATMSPWNVPGYAFAVAPSAADTLTFTTAYSDQASPTDSGKVTARIGDDLERQGFVFDHAYAYPYKHTFNLDPKDEIATIEQYARGDDTCVLSRSTEEYIQLSCFARSSIAETAKEYKPFADAYLAANPNTKAKDLTLGPLDIKSRSRSGVIGASATAGYDIAEQLITVAGYKHLVLYYRHGNDSWQYATSASDEYGFSCEDMQKSPDARKAFYDQVCYKRDAGQIRLDSTRRALQ